MKLNYSRSGGFAGLTLNAALDTSNLPNEELTDLRTLLDKCLKMNFNPASSATTVMDGHHYSLTIQDDDQSKTIEADDGNCPELYQELFTLVVKLSRK